MRFLCQALLFALIADSIASVCFGPCFPDDDSRSYEIRSDSESIKVECSRNYEDRQFQKGCNTNMKQVWTLASDSVNEFADMERSYEEEGRKGAELACERVCGATNSCEAFGVSSDAHVQEGLWHCIIYFTCVQKQFNEHLDLYERIEPVDCLIKATSFDGVFVNYMESNGALTQTARVLTLPTKPFQDVHVQVNGDFNTTFLGYRPYKEPKEPYCDQYDSDCVILHAGGYSAVIVSVFCIIIAFNSCVLYVSFTKPNHADDENIMPKVRLRKRAQENSNLQFAPALHRRSNRISF